jgi:hypothetical protein
MSELRTTTLVVGPFQKTLGPEVGSLLGRFIARAISHGFAVAKTETEQFVTVIAVQSVPRTQPFTRVRDLVPGAVVTALAGEATAVEEGC